MKQITTGELFERGVAGDIVALILYQWRERCTDYHMTAHDVLATLNTMPLTDEQHDMIQRVMYDRRIAK